MPSPLNRDPTRTITLRNRATAQINRRFDRISLFVRRLLTEQDFLGGLEDPLSGRSSAQSAGVTERLKAFNRLLAVQLSQHVFDGFFSAEQLEAPPESPIEPIINIEQFGVDGNRQFWLNVFLGAGYLSGVQAARNALRRVLEAAGFVPSDSPWNNPAHIDRMNQIYERSFNNLRGVTDRMSELMVEELGLGILQGESIDKIVRRLIKVVESLGKVRARLIARTEIVRAHAMANIEEASQFEVNSGEEVRMRWHTSLDGRERDTHRTRHNKVYTRQEAVGLIGEPNCRCSVSPWLDEFENAPRDDLPDRLRNPGG